METKPSGDTTPLDGKLILVRDSDNEEWKVRTLRRIDHEGAWTRSTVGDFDVPWNQYRFIVPSELASEENTWKFPFDGITVKVFRMPEDDGESVVVRPDVIYREWESPDLEDFQYLCREYGIKKAHRYGTRVNEIEFTSRELPGIGTYVVEVLQIGAWPVGTWEGDREVLEDLSRIVRTL